MKNKKIYIVMLVLLFVLSMCRGYSINKEVTKLDNIRVNAEQGDTVDRNGVIITNQCNEEFLNEAINCHELVRKAGFEYGTGRALPVTQSDELKIIDASCYVSMVLDAYGLKDWNDYPHQLTVSGGTLVEYARQKNFEFVYEGDAASINEITNLQSGDIIIMPGHTQIFYGRTSSGELVWLNCGSNQSISKEEGQDNYLSNESIKYVIRVPKIDKNDGNQSDNSKSVSEQSENNIENETSDNNTIDKNGVTLTSKYNANFLNYAIDCHKLVREQGFEYGMGRSMPVTQNDKLKYIDASGYISMVLDAYGLKDWKDYPHQLTVSGRTLIEYARQKNFEFVYEGNASDISEITDLQSGDIVIMPGHTQIFYGYTSSGDSVWLNCGSTTSIRKQEGTEYGWYATPIKYVIRVPNSDIVNKSQISSGSSKSSQESGNEQIESKAESEKESNGKNSEVNNTATRALPDTGDRIIILISIGSTVLLCIIGRKKIRYKNK